MIVSRRDATTSVPQPIITVESVGTALYERHSWDQRRDLTTMGAHDAAHSMWERTSLQPTDVDVAELYDGFSYLTVQWLEAMGFCEHGKVGPFIEDGHRIAIDGDLPLNTHGGQLSSGRLHGFGFVHEARVPSCAARRGAVKSPGSRRSRPWGSVAARSPVACSSAGANRTGRVERWRE